MFTHCQQYGNWCVDNIGRNQFITVVVSCTHFIYAESLGEQRFSWGDIGNAIATFTGAIITTAGNEISKGGKHLQETAGTGSPPVALPTEMGDGDAAADTPEVTTIGFKESIGIVQAKHNDKIVFFQNGQVFSKNTGAKGDTDATDQCKNLCAKTVSYHSEKFAINVFQQNNTF